MDFLGIGGWEIFLIIIVALLLWGPGRIVEISRTLGKIISNLKKTTSELTAQLTTDLEEQKKEETSRLDNSRKG
jgi:sec-independent protein translocase protein TatA